MEELHRTVYAPVRLKDTEYNAMHRTRIGKCFRGALNRAAENVVRTFPSVRKAPFHISRGHFVAPGDPQGLLAPRVLFLALGQSSCNLQGYGANFFSPAAPPGGQFHP